MVGDDLGGYTLAGRGVVGVGGGRNDDAVHGACVLLVVQVVGDAGMSSFDVRYRSTWVSWFAWSIKWASPRCSATQGVAICRLVASIGGHYCIR